MTREVSKDKKGDIVTVSNERSKGVKQYADPNGTLTDNRSNRGQNPAVDCKNGSKPDIGEVIRAAETLKTSGAYFSEDDKHRSAEGPVDQFMGVPMRQHNLVFAQGSPIKALCSR